MRIALLVAVLAGCGGVEPLPDSFRVDAEIVSVEPGPSAPPNAGRDCTPTLADTNPDGPDWRLAFARVNDPEEPTFKEWYSSTNLDSAAVCQNSHGGPDCCEPLVDGPGGRVLSCLGADNLIISRNRFVFTFADDGSGTAESTATSTSTGKTICIARVRWGALLPVE